MQKFFEFSPLEVYPYPLNQPFHGKMSSLHRQIVKAHFNLMDGEGPGPEVIKLFLCSTAEHELFSANKYAQLCSARRNLQFSC